MTDIDAHPSPDETRRASVPARIIVLADGRPWGLALPTPRYRPEIVAEVDELGRPTETIRLLGWTGYPLSTQRLVDELRSACRAEVNPEAEDRRFDALMALAVALLRRAHDLTPLEAIGLLDLDGGGLLRLVDAVLATVAGVPSDPLTGSVPSTSGGGNA